jgi:hypothetical protein
VSDYTKTTDFAAKDSLSSGDPEKIILGADLDAEFEALETAIASKADKAVGITTATDNYTLVITDAFKTVAMNAATSKSITIPPNSSVAFDVGTIVGFTQTGAGATSVVAGSGVTIQYNDGTNAETTTQVLAGQYAFGGAQKLGTNTWRLFGNFTP